MDTKLKRFNQNKITRVAAFFLCIVFFLGSLTGFGFLYGAASTSSYGAGVDDLLLYDNYQNSAVFQREFDEKLSSILYLLDEYKSEAYINSGRTISEQRMDEALQSMFYQDGYAYSSYSNSGEAYSVAISGGSPYQRYGAEYYDPGVQEKFKVDYAEQIAELKKTMIMDDLRAFEQYQKDLAKVDGFTYYATNGTDTVTNAVSPSADNTKAAVLKKTSVDLTQFEKAPAYLIYKDDQLTKVPVSAEGINGSMKNFDKSLEARLDEEYEPKLNVYFSFDQSYLDVKGAEFNDARAEFVKWMPMAIGGALLSLILFIYLIVITGKKEENGSYHVYKVDKIFTEIQLAIIGVLFVGGGSMFGKFLFGAVDYGVSFNGDVYYNSDPLYLSVTLAAVIGLLSAGFGLFFLLSVIRNIKAGRFFKNALSCIIVSSIWRGLKDLYHGGSLMRKVVLITLAICVLSATIILAPVVAILILILAPKWVKKFEAVKKGVDEVKNGNLAYKIKTDGDDELDELAKGINQISEASNVAIQSELKNQRMKTDLISNVSHDLKTPLTSIITYIDLLKTEGLDNPEAPKYLEILDQKSIRLKNLTEDLFDAAKASSGAIPVKFEKVEMLSLINQGLGEMSDRIEASNLEFKINAQNEKYYVRADGQLLWRVVENLLNNVLKYAQEGSRVYIDLNEQSSNNGGLLNVTLEIKNISKAELNINADELMERFKRGDESRATEGSGLGLAIAKDLVRLQNGWFELKIDGDLFKAIVMMEAYSGEEEK